MKYCKTLASICILLSSGMSVSGQVSVDIDTRHGTKVERMKYGWHYEEIGMIGDGGLYAELVRNRGFEEANPPAGLSVRDGLYQDVPNPRGNNKKVYAIDPLVGWSVLPLTSADVRADLTDRNPLNASNPHSLLVRVSRPGSCRIVNSGYYGMHFRKGVPVRLSLYACAMKYRGRLEARLTDGDGKPCSAPVAFDIAGKGWTQFKADLVPESDVDAGMLSLSPTAPGTFQLDMVSMFPSDTWDNGKSVFRSDVMQNLVDYRPDFLRFPGGCLVHGVNEATMYHWKSTIGDIAARPGAWGKWLPHYRTDGLGYHEFYELCEYLGCDAMYVAPTGMVCTEWVKRDKDGTFLHDSTDVSYYIQDLLDAIEYAIGPVDSRWGAERDRNGHPAPFPLKYVEIGNEDYGPVYNRKYHEIYRAVKKAYPQLSYVTCSPIGQESDKQQYLKDFVSRDEIEIYDEHYYHDISWARNMFDKFDSYSRKGPALFVAELGINGSNPPDGLPPYPTAILCEGIFKMGMERNGDLRPLMADRPLMRNWDFIGRSDMQPLVLNSSSASVRTFNYWLCKMLRDNKIDVAYSVNNGDTAKTLFVTAGRDLRTKELVLKVVNLSPDATTFRLGTRGKRISPGHRFARTVLTAEGGRRATPLDPDAVLPVTSEGTMPASGAITVPGSSFTVYRITK